MRYVPVVCYRSFPLGTKLQRMPVECMDEAPGLPLGTSSLEAAATI